MEVIMNRGAKQLCLAEWIASNEIKSLEDQGYLLEVVSSLRVYLDVARRSDKDYVSIKISDYEFLIKSLLNNASSIGADAKNAYHLMRLFDAQDRLLALITDQQVEQITKELIVQLNQTQKL